MDTTSSVGLSGQVALERRLTAIANNIANAGTAGFRAQVMKVSANTSPTSPFATVFASVTGELADGRSGPVLHTGNAMDVAISGSGFLAIETPAGTAYTRDGRLTLSPDGALRTIAGHAVLDEGGAPVLLDPAGGPIDIAGNGIIQQNGRRAATLGLFQLDLTQPMRRFENSGLVPDRAPEPVTDFSVNGFQQGYIEQSNVNSVSEMTNLIAVSRMFEAISTAIDRRDTLLRDAIQTLGGRS